MEYNSYHKATKLLEESKKVDEKMIIAEEMLRRGETCSLVISLNKGEVNSFEIKSLFKGKVLTFILEELRDQKEKLEIGFKNI